MVVPAITTFSGLATQLVAIKALMHYCILDIVIVSVFLFRPEIESNLQEIARQNLEFILISIDQSTSEAKEVLISVSKFNHFQCDIKSS
jgi:hypothetical protein